MQVWCFKKCSKIKKRGKKGASKGRSKVCVCARNMFAPLIDCMRCQSISQIHCTTNWYIQCRYTTTTNNGSRRIANGFIESSHSFANCDLFMAFDGAWFAQWNAIWWGNSIRPSNGSEAIDLNSVIVFWWMMWCFRDFGVYLQNTTTNGTPRKFCRTFVSLTKHVRWLFPSPHTETHFHQIGHAKWIFFCFVSKFKLQCLPCNLVPQIKPVHQITKRINLHWHGSYFEQLGENPLKQTSQ